MFCLHVYVCTIFLGAWCLRRLDIYLLGLNGVTNSHELPCERWELNLSLLEEQPVILTTKPYLQLPSPFLNQLPRTSSPQNWYCSVLIGIFLHLYTNAKETDSLVVLKLGIWQIHEDCRWWNNSVSHPKHILVLLDTDNSGFQCPSFWLDFSSVESHFSTAWSITFFKLPFS